jgi:hypothetical protein
VTVLKAGLHTKGPWTEWPLPWTPWTQKLLVFSLLSRVTIVTGVDNESLQGGKKVGTLKTRFARMRNFPWPGGLPVHTAETLAYLDAATLSGPWTNGQGDQSSGHCEPQSMTSPWISQNLFLALSKVPSSYPGTRAGRGRRG